MQAKKRLIHIIGSAVMSAYLVGCSSNQPHTMPNSYTAPQRNELARVSLKTNPATGATPANALANMLSLFGDNRTTILQRLAAQHVQVVASGERLKLIIFTDGCFEFGTSALTPRCQNVLAASATLLQLNTTAPIKVAAYSDNNFSATFALQLTQAQADSVVAYLWAHGIAQTRFYAIGYGSAEPIATNNTVQGNGLNRRVEITVG